MLTGRQLNCFRGSGCLSQIEFVLEKKRNAILLSQKTCLGHAGFFEAVSIACYSGLVRGVGRGDRCRQAGGHDFARRCESRAALREHAQGGALGHAGSDGDRRSSAGDGPRYAPGAVLFLRRKDLRRHGFNSDGPPTPMTAKARPPRSPLRRTSRAPNWKRCWSAFAEPFCKRRRRFRPRRLRARRPIGWRASRSPWNWRRWRCRYSRSILLEFDGATARICVRCSAGTYLRGIAHDVGQRARLRRVSRRPCGAPRRASSPRADARTLEALEELARAGALDQALIPASQRVA